MSADKEQIEPLSENPIDSHRPSDTKTTPSHTMQLDCNGARQLAQRSFVARRENAKNGAQDESTRR